MTIVNVRCIAFAGMPARSYSGGVAKNENRAAHGGICQVWECRDCGAARLLNRNGHHVEKGPWFVPEGKDGAA